MSTVAIDTIAQTLQKTRAHSLSLCAPLSAEDCNLQGAEFASPPKWHLAHTTWFFETFILKPFAAGYRPAHPTYEVLFNSYYQGVGAQHPRSQRSLLSRPSLGEVIDYRSTVDAAMATLLSERTHPQYQVILERCVLGIEHERQHQELLLTDIKYSFSRSPLYPAYSIVPPDTDGAHGAAAAFENKESAHGHVTDRPLDQNRHTCEEWVAFEGGLVEIGHTGAGFAFDNELPRHQHYLAPYALCTRLVSNADYQDFIDDGGYRRPELWLAEGWEIVQREGWTRPLYWTECEGVPTEFTLYGLRPRGPANPVCHLSGYEAEAFARWRGARLPTEQEWEHAACAQGELQGTHPEDANTVLHPSVAEHHASTSLAQLYGSCWQWTRSAYTPYPGYAAAPGAIGEYNGKFMSNQWVLRGSSCVSARSQSRFSYRNFFYAQDRWQFSGLRLARDQ